MAVDTEGRREIIGLHIGPVRGRGVLDRFPARPGQARAVRCATCHLGRARGLKAAICRVLKATWQSAGSLTANALAYVPRAQQTMVAAGLRHASSSPTGGTARAALHHLAEQLHNRWPKLKGFIDATSEDVLAYLTFPLQHERSCTPQNPLERSTRRSSDAPTWWASSQHRLDPASDRSRAVGGQRRMAAQHRYMQIEGMAGFTRACSTTPSQQFHLRPPDRWPPPTPPRISTSLTDTTLGAGFRHRHPVRALAEAAARPASTADRTAYDVVLRGLDATGARAPCFALR